MDSSDHQVSLFVQVAIHFNPGTAVKGVRGVITPVSFSHNWKLWTQLSDAVIITYKAKVWRTSNRKKGCIFTEKNVGI